ncbi:hypothetical protein AURDEDRAFT_162075 [Auricularia subglabra TFB-10046 SS5]|nr:hypothetical protein AURDEDRAFT_162075 [Auricularia subglabra TFB-10046 SS5]
MFSGDERDFARLALGEEGPTLPRRGHDLVKPAQIDPKADPQQMRGHVATRDSHSIAVVALAKRVHKASSGLALGSRVAGLPILAPAKDARHNILLSDSYCNSSSNRSLARQQPAATSAKPRRAVQCRPVAVGDLHGEFPKALTIARTGGIADRGPHALPLCELIVHRQALEVGRQVVSTHGNHEWMSAIGDWRYVSQAEIQTFGGVAERQSMLAKGWVGRAWRDNYTVAARVPLHPSLGPDRKQPPPHPPAPYPGLPLGTTPAEERLCGSDDPQWYPSWAHNYEADACAKVDGVLAKLGARRMVVRHRPGFEVPEFFIDTGISQIMCIFTPSGDAWEECEVLHAIYES